MPKNNGIESALYSRAEIKFNFKIQIKARVIPQPKQEIPKRFFIGHNELLKIFVRMYKTVKKILHVPKQYKEYLFSLRLFLILYQRLSITISEAAGKNSD